MTDVVRRQAVVELQKRRERAQVLAHEIRAGSLAICAAWIHLARIIWEFREQRHWMHLDYESIEAFVADVPGMEKRRFHLLAQMYSEFVDKGRVPLTALQDVDLYRLEPAVKALKNGKVTADQAIEDARVLSQSDMREKYAFNGRDPDAPLDAFEEPELCICQSCGKAHRPERRVR